MERLTFSLRREEALLELWENTSAQLKEQEELNKNLESQIDKLNKVILSDRDEMDRLKKNTADLKRQSYGKGMTLGVVVGVVGTLVALVVIN
jgi:predicted RNase H-like nuclease (RuvC/YqgF family)